MKHSVIRLSLIFLVIHSCYGFSLPRIDVQNPTRLLYKYNDGSTLSISNSYAEKPTLKEIKYYHFIERPYPQAEEKETIKVVTPEETMDSIKAVDIDPRKDQANRKGYTTITEKPDHGKRQRREVSLQRNQPETRSKRANYRSWIPFSSSQSRMQIQYLPEYVRQALTEGQLVQNQQNPKYAYLVGHPLSSLADNDDEVTDDDESSSEISSDEADTYDDNSGPNVIEYLEYDDSVENPEEDDGISNDSELIEDNKPRAKSVSIENTTSRNNISREYSKLSGTPIDGVNGKNAWDDDNDYGSEEDSGSIECEDGDDCEESGEDTNTNLDDILKEIHQIFVEENSTIELAPGIIDNPENFNIFNLLHNVLKDHSKTTIIKANPNHSNFLDSLRGLFTNIVKNNVIVNNNVPVTHKPIDVTAEKDRPDDTGKTAESTKKPVSEQNFKDHNATTESPKENVTPTIDKSEENLNNEKEADITAKPISEQNFKDHNATTAKPNENVNPIIDKTKDKSNISTVIDQNKDKDITPTPLDANTTTTTVKNPADFDKNKTNNTDKNKQVNSSTETSTIEEGGPATPSPNKTDNNTTNKNDSTDEDKKIDFMLDLVNNENFWKFMGDLGGKYLESLMVHASSIIKEQIRTQIKEHLDALKKPDDEKLELENKKEKEKEDKPVNGKLGEDNTEAKKINETVSIKAHNLFGNTVGNDKVTNVYVFYANEHIDEIFKNINEIANKTYPANSTNIFTFVPNPSGLNNGTSESPTPIATEVTTEIPKTTVDHATDRPNIEQKASEPSMNGSNIKHPNNTGTQTQADLNCDSHQSHCDKNESVEVTTKPSKNTEEVQTITVSTTENAVDSTTVSKEQTPEVTTSVIDLIPEKDPVTETNKVTLTTENVLSKETVTANIDITTESVATMQTITESTHNTIYSETTSASFTTKSVISTGSTVTDADGSTTKISEDIIHKNNGTSLNTLPSDDDKAKVTTESMKPVPEIIGSASEITSTIPTTISDTTTVSTIEQNEGINHKKNETAQNINNSDEDKSKVSEESMKPMTDQISSTESAATKETTKESDLKDISTTSSTKIDQQTNHTNSEPFLNIQLSGNDTKTDKNNSESITDNIKLTTEAVSPLTTISGDKTGSDKPTEPTKDNDNSTHDRSEISTTESSEHKSDNINITTESATDKTTENTNSTNDESKITTEKSETTKADTDLREGIESITDNQEKAKS